MGGDLLLATPVFVKDAPDVPLADGYDPAKIKDTQIATVSTKPVDSEIAASTYEQTPKNNYVIVFDGGQYLVKTEKGKIFSVIISEVQGSDNTASAKLTISPSGI